MDRATQAEANFNEVASLLGQVDISPSQASLQGSNALVGYDLIGEKNAVNYQDRQAYEGYALQFADETRGIVELEQIDKWGEELASMLYTYRSIARALPTVSGDEAHKRGMYAASFEVLHPAITRLKTLIAFKERAVAKWTSNLALLVRAEAKQKSSGSGHGEAPIPCEALYVQLLHTLDGMAVLDSLKDTKACLNNDFSTYKRAFMAIRADVPDQEQITSENALLQPFLANPQTLLAALRHSVQRQPGYDSVVAEMANLALEHLECDWYVLPAEKHRLLRAAANALWLLDSDAKGGANAFHHKRIQRARFGRWFRRYPIVPMYGDMFANLQHVLHRCPNYAAVSADEFFATSRKEVAQVRAQYDLALRVPALRQPCAAFLAELAALLRTLEIMGGGARLRLPREEHTRLARTLAEATLRGLRLMSELGALLPEALAYKCAHPCDDALLATRCKAGNEWCDYERAFRYNLADLERAALVELLSLLKGLQASLRRVCGAGEVLLGRHVHEACQLFVHATMGGPMRKSVKYEKKALKATMLQLRNMAADWSGNAAELMDEKKIVSKEFKFASHAEDYPARSCGPSQTQLWLLRATARSLYDERSNYTKSSLMNEADLSKETVKEMRKFVEDSASFPHLLRLSSTLDALGDVSCLWMREFYLELCQRVQFPISMSLPAILIEHVLHAGNGPLMPMLLVLFDGYSDAGHAALAAHAQQHLFVEIEAEANLLFDQVLYSLAEQIFATYKARAAVALLGEFGLQSDAPHDAEVRAALGKNWYLPLLHTRHARVLGRSLDLGRLITQRMNTMVRGSLELAVAKYEAKSLDAVIELHHAIAVTRLTHTLLLAELPDLDAFDALLNQQTDQCSFLSFSSRILTHALTECLSDLLPNFAYRSDGGMFQRPLPTGFTQPPEREPHPKAAGAHLGYGTRMVNAEYAMAVARTSGFFGAAHAAALVGVLGDGGLQMLLATLNEHVEELLLYAVHAYVQEMQHALPDATKLPSYQYGAQGCYLFFEAKLKDLANYEELHSGVLHSFRRLGNCFALLTLLETAAHSHATVGLHQLVPKGQPLPLVKAATAVAEAWGQDASESDLVLLGEQASALCRPLASSSSLLSHALVAATHVLSRVSTDWLAGETRGGDLAAHETSRAFHRVWSAVSFLFATAPYESAGRGTVDNATLFGDGVLLAGSLLLHALDQRHRFEMLDFAGHVFAVHLADAAGPTEPGLLAFVHRVAMMKRAHDCFAAMLEARDAPTIYNVWRRMP